MPEHRENRCRTWNSPDRRTWAGSLGSMDARYEPTHYHSEYGCGRLIAEKNHVGRNRVAKRPLATPEPGL